MSRRSEVERGQWLSKRRTSIELCVGKNSMGSAWHDRNSYAIFLIKVISIKNLWASTADLSTTSENISRFSVLFAIQQRENLTSREFFFLIIYSNHSSDTGSRASEAIVVMCLGIQNWWCVHIRRVKLKCVSGTWLQQPFNDVLQADYCILNIIVTAIIGSLFTKHSPNNNLPRWIHHQPTRVASVVTWTDIKKYY